MNSFAEKGYVIVKNAIRKSIINNLQSTILENCGNSLKSGFVFCNWYSWPFSCDGK